MAIVGSLMVLVGVNNAPLAAGLASSQAQLKGFAGTAGATFAALRTLALGAGIGVVAGLGLGVRAAASFQEQMATINTIARLTPERLAAVGDEIRGLATATGTGLPDLTAGFYDLLSVGVPVGQAMEFLANANTLAIGGLGTTTESVNAITTAINSWGIATGAANLTMADSTKVMDIFAKVIELGDVKAGELPEALSNVASSAAAMNVPLEHIGAGFAIMTTKGFTAAKAATSMDAALAALQKRPPGMEQLERATGKSYQAIAKTDGIQAAMQALVSDAKKFDIELVDVFGRKEALPFARMITGAGTEGWDAALAAMFDAGGTAAGQMDEKMGTLSRQMDIFGASVNDLGISVGTFLLPPLTAFVQGVNGAIQSISAWVSSGAAMSSEFAPVIQTIVGRFQDLWTIAQEVGVVIMDLATRVWEGGLNKALDTAAQLIGSVIDVVGGIATAILENEDAMNILRKVADAIGTGFGLAFDAVSGLLDYLGRLGEAIRTNETLMQSLADIGNAISGAFVAAGPAIQAVIDAILEAVRLAGAAADEIARLAGGGPVPPGPLGATGPGGRVGGPVVKRGIDPIGQTGDVIGGIGDWIFRGGRPEGAPVQINSTTTVVLDGEKVGSVTERRLYNNASQYSSGFNGGALENR